MIPTLETVKAFSAVMTLCGLATALLTTRTAWVDKRVSANEHWKIREYASLMLFSKFDVLSLQGIIFYLRFRSLMTDSPVEPTVRALQYEGALWMAAMSGILFNRSLRYLRSRRRILSHD